MTQVRRSDAEIVDGDVVVLTVPANGAYLAVLRTATAGIAARLQYTLDEIEDLRIAVDEACGMLIPVAAPGSELSCRFEITKEVLTVRVSVPTRGVVQLPPAHSFAWRVLTTLAAEVSSATDDEQATIGLAGRGAGHPPKR